MSKNNNILLKPEISQPLVEAQNTEVKSCSSGKQRRLRFPSKFMDIPVSEERRVSSIKPRSPSPPVRRSISTDRGALIRPRIKSEVLENPPVTKVPFPASVSVHKSTTNVHAIVPSKVNARPYQEPLKQDNLLDVLNNVKRVTFRKVNSENEEEQFRQVLNVRQGGIRKTKPESKMKTKHQSSARIRKSGVADKLLSDTDSGKLLEQTQKLDFSDPENDPEPVRLPVNDSNTMKNLHRNSSRDSQNVGPRELLQKAKENKFSSIICQNVKESGNSSLPEFPRSRSTPRGKFII